MNKPEKEAQTKPKANGRKEIRKIRKDINEIEKRISMKPNFGSLKINKIDRLTKKSERLKLVKSGMKAVPFFQSHRNKKSLTIL